jgi:hypothetical protein
MNFMKMETTEKDFFLKYEHSGMQNMKFLFC